jgi:hypothetical protein
MALATPSRGPDAPSPAARLLRALLVSAPAWAVTGAAFFLTLRGISGDPGAGFSVEGGGPTHYALTQARVVWLYARLALFPAGQALEHPFDPSPGLVHAPTIAALAGLVAALAAAVFLWRRGGAPRAAAVGILWWFLLLSPTSSVVPIIDLVAEHRVYLALAGLALSLAVGLDALVS